MNDYNEKIHENYSFDNWTKDNINVLWVGHSTILINFYGTIILTDPVMFETIGVYFMGENFGQERLTPPAVGIDDIPQPDLILLSHAHMDHTDCATLEYLTNKFSDKITVLCAPDTREVIEEFKWKEIEEMDWNEEFNLGDLKVTALEVRHNGWRFPWEYDRSRGEDDEGKSYNAYILEKNDYKILFAGDTAYTDKWKELVKDKINLVLMPIGAYEPYLDEHVNPEQAMDMVEDVNADVVIPMHAMTFDLSEESFFEPIRRFKKAVSKSKVELGLENIGESWSLLDN